MRFRCFNCGYARLTAANVLQVYYLSMKYMAPTLTRLRRDFLRSSLTAYNACIVLDDSLVYGDEALKRICLDFVSVNSSEVLASEAYFDVTTEARSLIDDEPRLNVCSNRRRTTTTTKTTVLQCRRWNKFEVSFAVDADIEIVGIGLYGVVSFRRRPVANRLEVSTFTTDAPPSFHEDRYCSDFDVELEFDGSASVCRIFFPKNRRMVVNTRRFVSIEVLHRNKFQKGSIWFDEADELDQQAVCNGVNFRFLEPPPWRDGIAEVIFRTL